MQISNLDVLKGDKKIPLRTIFKRIWKYVKPEIWSFILGLLMMFVSVAAVVILPMIVGELTDYLGKEDNIVLWFVVLGACGYLLVTIIGQVFTYLQTMILQKAGQRIIYNLRMEVFDHIEHMSQNQLNDMPVGSLVTRVANYTTSMSDLFTDVLANLLKNLLTIIAVFILMLITNIQIAGIMCGFVAIVFVTSLVFGYVVRKIFTKERRYISDMNTYLDENLSGMKIIQIFNKELKKDTEFLERNEALRKARYEVVIAFALYRPFISFLYFAALAATFYFGMVFAISAGSILEFYLLLSNFFNPVQKIADQLNEIQKAVTASERLFNLMDVKPEVIDNEDAKNIDRFVGKIEFKNVWFAYENDNWILKDVSFTVEPKQTVAFVGATGAGKTTILSLIVRNFEPQKGDIFIDGINIKNIKIESLRKAVGQMLQDVFLFSGNIKTNITLHDESYSDDKVMEVAKYVNADSFIDKCKNGLYEEVIERGENFSQGQRQLMSFARTVLHDPQILILDEATANIDTETEKLIQDSLEKIKNIGTMLVVAHRLSTIQNADKIIVLDGGKIVESGTHQELLKNRNLYYKLYELQFKK